MKIDNLPIGLTISRMLLVPVVILTFLWSFPYHEYLCAALFGLASLTDWLDGYLARSWNVTTQFGAFLDPVADKILTVFTLVLIVSYYDRLEITLLTGVLIGREIVILALRDWMAQLGKRHQVNVMMMAKLKTVFLMVAIILMILGMNNTLAFQVGMLLMWVAGIMTLISMFTYIKVSWKDLTLHSGM